MTVSCQFVKMTAVTLQCSVLNIRGLASSVGVSMTRERKLETRELQTEARQFVKKVRKNTRPKIRRIIQDILSFRLRFCLSLAFLRLT